MLDTVSEDTAQGPRHYVDTTTMPQWGTAGDGSSVRLGEDAELRTDFAAWLAQACAHPQQFTGKTINAGGVEVFKRYCRACGIATTQSLPHRTIAGTTVSLIDAEKREALVDAYTNRRRDALDEIASRAANRAQPSRRAGYSEYLSGPEWRELRASVMDRCAGLCEGCRKRPAHDVHHLSYAHLRCEFLFELVALCRDCHKRWHEQSAR